MPPTLIEALLIIVIVCGVAFIVSHARPDPQHRYRIHITGNGYFDADSFDRLQDGGIAFIRYDGRRVEVHGTYEIIDRGVQAEAK